MSSEALTSGPIGWFGKLPATGDFLRRDLPDEFVGAWDRWLQQGMASAAQSLGEDWQDLFLRFPIWHFLRTLPAPEAPRPAVPSLWAGLLAPSVDRVGRLFPLTVAFHLPARVFLPLGFAALEHRLNEIASLVLDVLADDDLEAFEQGLAALPALAVDTTPEAMPAAQVRTPDLLIEALGRQALFERLASHALFWAAPALAQQALLLAPEPLQADLFCRLVLPSSLPVPSD